MMNKEKRHKKWVKEKSKRQQMKQTMICPFGFDVLTVYFFFLSPTISTTKTMAAEMMMMIIIIMMLLCVCLVDWLVGW